MLLLTGPRQSGKTTLLKRFFPRHAYRTLELPHVRAAALADPQAFLNGAGEPLLLDEVQHAPGLLDYIKARIDARRNAYGRFVLTGSQQFSLMKGVGESLAGRAAVLRLEPFSLAELAGVPQRPLLRHGVAKASGKRLDLWRHLVRGLYPEVATRPRMEWKLWLDSYLATYLERDVRDLRQVGDLTQFQAFMRALAARSGQLLNLADLSRDLGVALNTCKQWLAVLEASCQVRVLRPYHENLGKRLVKTPKVYFTDTGLLGRLLEAEAANFRSGPLAGPLWETAVVNEVAKRHDGPLYFWRTSDGREVDLVLPRAGRLVPIEAKLNATPKPEQARGLGAFRDFYGAKAAPGFLVHPGDERLALGASVTAVPLLEL